MARPLRIEFSGALYHITARGDRREPAYEDDDDRRSFLDILGTVTEDFNWVCHAWCLMDNHYHLLVETPDGNLAKGMRQINGVYTQWSNRRSCAISLRQLPSRVIPSALPAARNSLSSVARGELRRCASSR